MDAIQWKMNSEIGIFYLVASAKGLLSALPKKQPVPFADSLDGPAPAIRVLAQAVAELREYFAGRRQRFSVPLDIVGTPFQKQVWRQLARIPYGQTCSYRDIARRIKNDKAVRAVGGANGKNPLCILVPCHRVIAADGTLGGYSGGLELKRKLLSLESADLLVQSKAL